MNIFVLNGHKYYPFAQGRLNQTLFDKITATLSPENEIKTTIVEKGYQLEEELEKFHWADIVIFQTPINWFSYPAIFKAYFDDVYRHGNFYGPSEKYGQGGLLSGKKYMYSLTWNSPEYSFEKFGEFYDGRGVDGVIVAMHKLQQYVGMENLKTFSCFDVVKHPDIPLFLADLEKHLYKYVLGKDY